MGLQHVIIADIGLVNSLNSETTLVDGMSIVELISGYAAARFAPNRKGFVDTAARLSGGPYKNQLINNTVFEMPFVQWAGLVDFVLNNAETKDSAKHLIGTLNVGDSIKEELRYSSTGIKNVVDYAYGYKFAPNLNSIFVEGLNNKVINGDGSNSFDISLGRGMTGKTVVIGVKDIDFVDVGFGTGTTDSSGNATINVTLSSFTSGYVYPVSCNFWGTNDLPNVLNNDIRLNELVNFSSYNFIGTSAVIAVRKSLVIDEKEIAIDPLVDAS